VKHAAKRNIVNIFTKKGKLMTKDTYFGYHLMLDCKEGNKILITDPVYIAEFAENLVNDIGMKAYGQPIIQNFAHDDPRTGGITLVQLIETSNITCHFVEATGDFYFDCFSCAPFDIDVVIHLVNNSFRPKSIRTTYLTRQA